MPPPPSTPTHTLTEVFHIYLAGSSQSVPAGMSQRSIRLSCDRHLLAVAHTAITLSPLLAVLKVTQVLSSLNFSKSLNSFLFYKAHLLYYPLIAGNANCQ